MVFILDMFLLKINKIKKEGVFMEAPYSSLSDQSQSYSSYLMFEATMAINETESLAARNVLRLTYVPLAIFAVVETGLAAIAAGFGKVKSGMESLFEGEKESLKFEAQSFYQKKDSCRFPQRDWTWLESSAFAVKWAFKNIFADYKYFQICDEKSQAIFDMLESDYKYMPYVAIFTRNLNAGGLKDHHEKREFEQEFQESDWNAKLSSPLKSFKDPKEAYVNDKNLNAYEI